MIIDEVLSWVLVSIAVVALISLGGLLASLLNRREMRRLGIDVRSGLEEVKRDARHAKNNAKATNQAVAKLFGRTRYLSDADGLTSDNGKLDYRTGQDGPSTGDTDMRGNGGQGGQQGGQGGTNKPGGGGSGGDQGGGTGQ